MLWVYSEYPMPQKWAFKKDMPSHLRHEAKRVRFRFETVYIAVDENGAALLPTGLRLSTWEFRLKTPGHVIGARDMQAASQYSWSFEWQTAFGERRLENIGIRA